MSKLQIKALQQMLHQYTPKERLEPKASTANGQFWGLEDLGADRFLSKLNSKSFESSFLDKYGATMLFVRCLLVCP
jgi:hypothetical protein